MAFKTGFGSVTKFPGRLRSPRKNAVPYGDYSLQSFEQLERRSLLSVDTIFPTLNGFAVDNLNDDTFASLTRNPSQISLLSEALTVSESRGFLEVDVSRYDAGQQFTSVFFEFAANSTIGPAARAFQIYAFAGNGLLTSADASSSGVLVGDSSSVTPSVVGGTVYNIPLNAEVVKAIATQGNYLTLQLRMTAGGGLTIPSVGNSGFPATWQPKVKIDSTGTSTPGLSIRLGNLLAENASAGAATGTVTRINADNSAALTVSLTSADTTELQVPSTVTIPAGAASITFPLNAVDELLLDGAQEVSVQATAIGFRNGEASLLVTDFEPLSVQFSPASVSEASGAGASLATVSRNIPGGMDQPLIVSLLSRTPAKATVPSSVTIPAGATSATFLVNVLDNEIVDGNAVVPIEASAAGFATGVGNLTVIDNDGGRIRPGNILVTSDNVQVKEYRPDGTLVQTFSLSSTSHLRDLAVDANGRVQVFTGSTAVLSTIDVATGNVQGRTFPDWNADNNSFSGGLATFGQYVFTSDFGTTNANRGVIRWDTANGYAAQRIQTDISIYDIAIGLDGLLYALQGNVSPNDEVRVFNPVTLAEVRRFSLPFTSHYGIAVDASGNIFTSAWGNAIYKYDSTGKLVDFLITDRAVKDIDIAPDGRLIASTIGFSDGCHVLITDTTLEAYTSFRVTSDFELFVAFANPGYLSDPQIAPSSGTTIYTEGSSVLIDPDLLLTDDGNVMTGATVRIKSGYSPGDQLTFSSFGGVSFAGFDSKTGTLTLSGTASTAAYQAALRTVRFSNFSDDPAENLRTILFSASDYGWVGTAEKSLQVVPVNDGIPVAVSNTYSTAEDTLLNLAPTVSTRLTMTSDSGEFVGQGLTYNISTGGTITQQLGQRGAIFSYGTDWTVILAAGFGQALTVGRYDNATRSGGIGIPTIDVSGAGRGSNEHLGYFDVREVEFDTAGTLIRFAADFVQYTEAKKPALRGTVNYRSTYNTKSGVLNNDTDIDGTALFVTAFTQPSSGGTVTVRPNGTFTYQPAPDFNGVDSFSYTASDGQGGLANGLVNINVTPVNDAPRVTNPSVSTLKNISVEGTLATDPDGNPLSFSVVQPPLHGTVSDLGGGRFRFTPAIDYSGPDTFTYSASDGIASPVTGVAQIMVLPGNTAPTSISISASAIPENQPPLTSVGTLSTIDPDAGDLFTYSLVSGTGSTDNGRFAIEGNTLKAAEVFDFETKSSYSIRLRATDQGGLYFEKIFAISVTNINEAATAVTLQNAITALPENSSTTSPIKVADILVIDDSIGTNMLSLTGSDAISFEIVGTELFLKAGTTLNFETQALLDINVQVDDTSIGGSPDVTVTHSLHVSNQPEGTTGNDVFVLTYSASDVVITIATNGNTASSLGTFSLHAPFTLFGLGGTDSVRIVGTTGNDVFHVAGAGSGLLINGSVLILDNTEDLLIAGGAGNDTYWFDGDDGLGLITLDESLGGVDTLDFSLTDTSSVVVSLGLATAQAVNPNLSLILKSVGTFENVIGGAGNDLITGNNLANILFGGNGNDSLLGGTGNDTLEGGAGNDTQDGGAGNDTYLFDADTNLGVETLSDTVGVDAISFTGTTANVVFSLGTTAAQNINGGRLLLTLNSASIFDNLTGGAGNDTLTGSIGPNTIVGGAGDDSLHGGAGNDIYLFDADGLLGGDILSDAVGTETISFAGTSAATLFSLASSGPQIVNPNLSLTLAVPATFDNLIGGSGNDTLTGNAGVNQLTGGSGDDSLNGGPGNDAYLFDADTVLGTDSLADDGGTDLLSFSGTTTKTVLLNLGVAGTAQTVNSNLSVILSTVTAFENVAGGMQSNMITGNGLANVLTGGAAADVLEGAGGNDILIGAAGDDTLTGGAGDDRYSFDADLTLGSDTVDEGTGSGIDTLEFVLTTTTGISVDLSSSLLQTVVAGKLSLTIVSADITIENIIGGNQDDTLIGNSQTNTLTGIGGNDTLSGGTGDDIYRFDVDAAQGADTVTDTSGVDTLDFMLSTAQGISIDLSSVLPQSVHVANLTLTIAASEIENVIGTGKDDTIIGNNSHNVLIGGAGNDILNGGEGADVLVGGSGNDSINGGTGEDLLIGGKTIYDTQIAKLTIISQVWSGPVVYANRLATLRAGVSGVTLTARTTVLNSGVDFLTGSDQQDWYFRSLDDVITDLFSGELIDFL